MIDIEKDKTITESRMFKNMAPVLLFCYDRIDCLKETVSALKLNKLASETPLIIYSDGPKPHNEDKIKRVREFIKEINGFKTVIIVEQDRNLGLANSVIKGVTDVLQDYEKVIILEDDIVTHNLFLSYMNYALVENEKNDKVTSITGFSYDFPVKNNIESYLYPRSSSKSWATYARAWRNIEFDLEKMIVKWGRGNINRTIIHYGKDLPLLLSMQEHKKVDSWAIRFCINQIMNGTYTVYPCYSYVSDIGDELGTHASVNLPHKVVFANRILSSSTANYHETVHNNYQKYLTWHVRKEFFYRIYRKFQSWFLR